MKTTAKIILNSKHESGVGEHRLVAAAFSANYAGGANKEWATSTPTLNVTMSLRGEIADQFVIGRQYTLTFDDDEG